MAWSGIARSRSAGAAQCGEGGRLGTNPILESLKIHPNALHQKIEKNVTLINSNRRKQQKDSMNQSLVFQFVGFDY